MSTTFAADYEWQVQFKPDMERIITSALDIPAVDIEFTTPDSDADRKFNTDIYLRYEGRIQRMSQRLRRYTIGDDFTLRYGRPSTRTEWEKLWAGFGDLLFYGRGRNDQRVDRWFIGRLDVLRSWVRDYMDRDELPPHTMQTNRDGSSSFVIFRRRDLPSKFVIASDDEEQEYIDACWTIVKNARDLNSSGHSGIVRWARAALGLDDKDQAA